MKKHVTYLITLILVLISSYTVFAQTFTQTSTASFDIRPATTTYYCEDCGNELNFIIGPKTIQWDSHSCTKDHGKPGWSLNYFPSWATTTIPDILN